MIFIYEFISDTLINIFMGINILIAISIIISEWFIIPILKIYLSSKFPIVNSIFTDNGILNTDITNKLNENLQDGDNNIINDLSKLDNETWDVLAGDASKIASDLGKMITGILKENSKKRN